MSISTVTDIVGPNTIASLPQEIAVTYPFQFASDLIVYSTGTSAAPVLPARVLTLNSDYTVTGGGYNGAGDMQTGTVTIVSGGANDVQVGENIFVVRRPPQTQTTSFLLTGFLTPEMIERALDKLTTLVQALQDGVNRSLRVPVVDGVLAEMLQSDRAGKIIAFDADGNLEFITISTATGQTEVDGTPGEIEVVTDPVTNVATVSLPGALIFTGKTITGGTYKSVVAIGINTATPLYDIDILNSTQANIRLFQTGGGVAAFILEASGDKANLASNKEITVAPMDGAPVGEFDASGWNGNAATATKLKTARTINGVSFDGTANITIPAGTGDVVGPAGATDGNIALYDGPTGKLLKDGVSPNVFVLRSRTALNVKDYGAVGDGVTSDTAAINSAFAALGAYGALFFPPGKYRLATSPSDISSKSNITVFGEGAEIYNDTGSSGGNTFTFDNSCSNVEVFGLRFTGTSSVRGNGVHIRMECSNSSIHHNQFSGCSDFAVLVSQGQGTGWISNVTVHDNFFGASLGDGVHVGSAVNVVIDANQFVSTGDDSIGIVADYPSYPPNRISITNNLIYDAGGSGVSGTGIDILEATDVNVVGNSIYQAKECGIFVGRYTSTTAYNARVCLINNKMIYTAAIGGDLGGGITVQFLNDGTIEGNKVEAPVTGGGIAFLDVNHLLIARNFIKDCLGRGIASDDGTTANVATNWGQIVIKGNTIDFVGTSGLAGTESIYVAAHSGNTISDVIVDGNAMLVTPAGNAIFYNNLANLAKIVFNSVLEAGRTIGTGGSGITPTIAYNELT